jgi:hypothetical protein
LLVSIGNFEGGLFVCLFLCAGLCVFVCGILDSRLSDCHKIGSLQESESQKKREAGTEKSNLGQDVSVDCAVPKLWVSPSPP